MYNDSLRDRIVRRTYQTAPRPVFLPLWRERELCFRVDESANQPRRSHAINSGTRPRHPRLPCEFFFHKSSLLLLPHSLRWYGQSVNFRSRRSSIAAEFLALRRREKIHCLQRRPSIAKLPHRSRRLRRDVPQHSARLSISSATSPHHQAVTRIPLRALSETPQQFPARSPGPAFPQQNVRRSLHRNNLRLDPLKIFPCLCTVRQNINGIFQSHRSHRLQPPPRLHAHVRRLRRQQMHEQ